MKFKNLLFLFFALACFSKTFAQKKFACSMYWFNQMQMATFESDIKKFDEALVNFDLNDNVSPPKIAAVADMQFKFGRKSLALSIFKLAYQSGYNYNFEPELASDSMLWKKFRADIPLLEKKRSVFYDSEMVAELKKISANAAKRKSNTKEILAHFLTLIEQRGFPTYKTVFSEGMNDVYVICRSLISQPTYAETLEPIVKQQTLLGNFDNLIYADISDRHKLFFTGGERQNFGTITQAGILKKVNEIESIDVRRAQVGLMPLKYVSQILHITLPDNYSYTDMKTLFCQ